MPTKLLLVVVFFSAFYCRQTGENDDEVNDDYNDNKEANNFDGLAMITMITRIMK